VPLYLRLFRSLLIAQAWIIKCLPGPVVGVLGCFIGTLLYHVFRFRRKIVRGQLDVVFEASRSPAEISRIERDVYRNLGMLIIEFMRLPRTSPESLQNLLVIHDQHHIDDALQEGKGVLMLLGHIGNWELTCLGLKCKGLNIHAIGKEMKSPVGEMFRQLIRDENSVPYIPRRGSANQILRALRANDPVGVMLDQNMTAEEGVFVDFFGHPACTMNALAVLARRSGALVVPAYSYRDADNQRHHIQFFPPIALESPHEDEHENDIHNTQVFTSFLQSMSEEHPDQWLWIHKRWRTRPADAGDSPFPY
jgi:KDO2-lipid IV(A) lauroyltransferase